ncbi:MAG: hypothetical protein ACR2JX_09495 [Mycobacteriales bacterium]
MIGAAVFCFSRSARSSFLLTMSRKRAAALGLSQINEVVHFGGLLAGNYALLLAPVAVVSAVMTSTQSVYMVLIGALLTVTFSHLIKENISRDHLVVKLAAITMITAGTLGLVLM